MDSRLLRVSPAAAILFTAAVSASQNTLPVATLPDDRYGRSPLADAYSDYVADLAVCDYADEYLRRGWDHARPGGDRTVHHEAHVPTMVQEIVGPARAAELAEPVAVIAARSKRQRRRLRNAWNEIMGGYSRGKKLEFIPRGISIWQHPNLTTAQND